MKFILIAVLVGFNGGGTTSMNVEFNSREACMAALTTLSSKAHSGNNIRQGGIFMCTPKG